MERRYSANEVKNILLFASTNNKFRFVFEWLVSPSACRDRLVVMANDPKRSAELTAEEILFLSLPVAIIPETWEEFCKLDFGPFKQVDILQ